MTVTVQVIIPAKYAENSQTTQFNSASITTIIDKFTATNESVGVAAISVNLVPNGGSAGASNLITKVKSLLPNEVYTFPELVGQVLAPGDSISTLSSTASAITIRASGRLITQ